MMALRTCPLFSPRYSMLALILTLTMFFAPAAGLAATAEIVPMQSGILDSIVAALHYIVRALDSVIFYDVFGFPLLVLWLIVAGVLFTLYLGFVNIRLFSHALQVITGRYDNAKDPGEVSHFQALASAVSGTVGLGNIAGVAVAVAMGGPGAVVWMMIAGFFGMTTKFVEVTMGHKYRRIDKETGKVTGGAFYYLQDGLKERGLPRLGKALAVSFAFFLIGASFASGNMFQSNQTVKILIDTFPQYGHLDTILALVLAVSVGIVLIGGIKRIARVAGRIVPFMAILYVGSCLVVIGHHFTLIDDAIWLMLSDAFTGEAVGGGIVGALIAGVRRATFSNEAGIGSAPIAHACAKTKEPVREGCVALLEPFLDTIVICFMTGLVITVTGVWQDDSIESGVLLTTNAFATVSSWFPLLLTVAVALFAYSTMITWSYYGERAWVYLIGPRSIGIYHVLFCFCTFLGGVIADLTLIVDLSDLMLFAMAFPNLLGLYLLAPKLKIMVKDYQKKLAQGKFKVKPVRG